MPNSNKTTRPVAGSDCLTALAALVAERIQHRDEDEFFTVADLAKRYDCDARAARDIAKRAGAFKAGLGYRVRRDHLLAWENEQAVAGRETVEAMLRPPTRSVRVSRTRVSRPEVPKKLVGEWWNEV